VRMAALISGAIGSMVGLITLSSQEHYIRK
jgi:hypothetical protein